MAPPSRLSDENRHVTERPAQEPAQEVRAGDGAGPSSSGRPARRGALQNQLLRKVLLKNAHRLQRTAFPVEESAQRGAPPAGGRNRMVALTQLNKAIHFGSDAQILTAYKLVIKHPVTEPRIDETDVQCLEKLVPWLKTSQNTSEIKSLKALAQSASMDEVNKV